MVHHTQHNNHTFFRLIVILYNITIIEVPSTIPKKLLTVSDTCKVIELYRELPLLWDSRSPCLVPKCVHGN